MAAFAQNRTRKVIILICLLVGLIGFLLLWSRLRNNYDFNIHDFDRSSVNELKSALLSHIPLGSQFDDVIKFLDQNGFQEAKSSERAACDDNYAAGSNSISIVTCTDFSFKHWEPIGWAIRFEFDDKGELSDIEIIGWPT